MITIPEVVKDIVITMPYLEEALTQGIINTSALARQLKPHIEELLYKKIQTGAIVMALKRMKKGATQKTNPKYIFTKTPDIIIRSNLVEFTLANSDTIINCLRKLLEQNPSSHKYFLTFTQGVFETAIITSADWKSEVDNILLGETIIGKQEDLSALTIILPETNVTTPGVYYYILKSLAWNNINIIDVVSTKEEFTLIFEEGEIDRAFSILKKLL